MEFNILEETVTAKEQTNLRSAPSQGENSTVLFTLQNGETALRIGTSDSGWSKLRYQGEVVYAVSSLLTTDLDYRPQVDPTASAEDDGIQTVFASAEGTVTAKDTVNLRTLPSVTQSDAAVAAQLHNGETAQLLGVSENGWSKLLYQGKTLYAVSSMLTTDLNYHAIAETEPASEDGPKTRFVPTDDWVSAKIEVNLRTMPSVTESESQVVHKLTNGEVIARTGINEDVGWSRVIYDGQTLYCVSSYLVSAKKPEETVSEPAEKS